MNWLEKLFINSSLHSVELRQFARFMLQAGGDVKGGKVMEIGCGRGMGVDVLFDLFGASYVEAFDYDPGQVRLAEKRLLPRYNDKVRIYEASATQIPSPIVSSTRFSISVLCIISPTINLLSMK